MAFVDDDAVLTSQWAEETRVFITKIADYRVTGPILPLWEEPSMAWFRENFTGCFPVQYFDWKEAREVRNGYGTNISFRRAVFDKGLFFTAGSGGVGSKQGADFKKQKTTAEETELSLKIRAVTGKRIEYNPEIVVYHKVNKFRFTTKYIWKRAYIEGSSKVMIRKEFRANKTGEPPLKTEYDLLQRIGFSLVPSILVEFFTHPANAWRKLRVTVVAVSAVGCGYFSGLLKKIPGGEVR